VRICERGGRVTESSGSASVFALGAGVNGTKKVGPGERENISVYTKEGGEGERIQNAERTAKRMLVVEPFVPDAVHLRREDGDDQIDKARRSPSVRQAGGCANKKQLGEGKSGERPAGRKEKTTGLQLQEGQQPGEAGTAIESRAGARL